MDCHDLPWYHRYAGDFIKLELTFEERGFLAHCFDMAWANCGLPVDQKIRQKILQADKSEFDRLWPIAERFFVEKNGRLIVDKQEEHRAKAIKKRELLASNGKLGGLAKAKANATPKAKAIALADATAFAVANLTSDFLASKEENDTITANKPKYSPRFEEFWKAAWNKNGGKDDAWKNWQTRMREGIDPSMLIEQAKKLGPMYEREASERSKGGPLMVSTWLSKGRWTDQFIEPKRTIQNGAGNHYQQQPRRYSGDLFVPPVGLKGDQIV